MLAQQNITELCLLFEKYGADKCVSIRHDYSVAYNYLLSDYRNKTLNILEIGIGNFNLMKTIVGDKYIVGASLRAWRDYFYNSIIYGIDIDESSLFQEDRIKTYLANQSCSGSLNNFIQNVILDTNNKNFQFNIIIDDGSHIFEDFMFSLEFFHEYLVSNGVYIIEDIQKHEMQKILENKYLTKNFSVLYSHTGPLEDDCFVALQKKGK